MSTFADFITRVETRIDNKNSRVDAYVRDATIRALKELSHVRSLFMQSTFSFNTVAGQNEYSSADTGFPKDVQEFDTIYVQTSTVLGSANYLITGPVPIEQVRALFLAGSQALYPSIWAWHHNKLCFAPTISGVVAVKGDYTKDATLDSTSGNAITASDTTTTNPWFDRGEQVLMNAVLMDYYLGIGKDSEAASMCANLYQSGLASIRSDLVQRSMKGMQAPANYGDFNGWM